MWCVWSAVFARAVIKKERLEGFWEGLETTSDTWGHWGSVWLEGTIGVKC